MKIEVMAKERKPDEAASYSSWPALCEQVIFEEGTRNVTLVNCFRERHVRQIPSEPLSFVTYALLTEARGEITVTVVLQRLSDWEEVYRSNRIYRFDDPLKEYSCIIRMRNISFAEAGLYQMLLLSDGEFLAQRRFKISKKEN
jgi:hypothetical protein